MQELLTKIEETINATIEWLLNRSEKDEMEQIYKAIMVLERMQVLYFWLTAYFTPGMKKEDKDKIQPFIEYYEDRLNDAFDDYLSHY